jgi:mRNA interferase MazF
MKRGSIIFIPFPFGEQQVWKNRHALVVSGKLSSGNIIVAFITSQLSKQTQNDIMLHNEENWFTLTGLKVSSLVKCEKLLTVEKSVIIGEFGTVPREILLMLDEKLKNILELQ